MWRTEVEFQSSQENDDICKNMYSENFMEEKKPNKQKQKKTTAKK